MSLLFLQLVVVASELFQPGLQQLVLALEGGVFAVPTHQLLSLPAKVLIQHAELVLHVTVLLE